MHSYEACIADQRLKHAAQRMYDVVRDEPRQEAHRELGKDIFHVSEPYARAQTEFDTPLCK